MASFRSMSMMALAMGAAVAATAISDARSVNELGRVMILEYHRIGEPEARWTRTPAGLRHDLQLLWEHGYRPISLGALVSGSIDLPAGVSPFVLTFDDSSPGQFRYIERDGHLEIDPECAVGILEAFARAHSSAVPATFFVLPAADEPNRLFGQPAHEARKLQYLVSRGFEIGNHTLWHADLSKYSEAVVKSQLARAQERVGQLVPGYRLRALALPMGQSPRQLEWAIRGSVGGVSYEHDAIVMVAGGAAPSPFSTRFDPYRLPRIQVTDGTLASWLKLFDQHPAERFTSDGDPHIVTAPRGWRGEVRARPGQAVRTAD